MVTYAIRTGEPRNLAVRVPHPATFVLESLSLLAKSPQKDPCRGPGHRKARLHGSKEPSEPCLGYCLG